MRSEQSYFDNHDVHDLYDTIRAVYANYEYPWVVGYSGGKDSTATLQAVWYAVSDLPQAERTKPIYVIASDTLVESPPIAAYIDVTLRKINDAALTKGLPFRAEKVVPDVLDSFWVNMIGRGYPAPSKRFRWCTERLKIRPANKFIRDKVSQHGKVVVVLGSRRAESATRAQVMALHRIAGMNLSRHSTLPNAYVFTPIEDLSTDDVWQYLFQSPNPWGGNNRDLAALYRTAQAGECPLVIDDTTPSCGNSRFGCWVCTVVQQEKSMAAMIDNGETWLEPLMALRNLLAETQEPARKFEFRDVRRRNGRPTLKADGSPIPGPYTFEFCADLLAEVLRAEQRMRQHDPSIELISDAELCEVQRIWTLERGDWRRTAEQIVQSETGRAMILFRDDLGLGGDGEQAVIGRVAIEHGLDAHLLQRLLKVEAEYSGMARRAGVFQQLEAALLAGSGQAADGQDGAETP